VGFEDYRTEVAIATFNHWDAASAGFHNLSVTRTGHPPCNLRQMVMAGAPHPGMKISAGAGAIHESPLQVARYPSLVTCHPSRFFTINAHGDGFSPPPGMKIGRKTLPTAHCPLFSR